MKKSSKWLWPTIVVILAVLPPAILGVGECDRRQRERQESMPINTDSLRQKHRNLRQYRLQEENLRTLEDSIHFYEDGL